jgi:hypothetical protein
MDPFLSYCGPLENNNEEIAALNRAQRQERRPSKVEWNKEDLSDAFNWLGGDDSLPTKIKGEEHMGGRVELLDLVARKKSRWSSC